jgi:hypothetical protein
VHQHAPALTCPTARWLFSPLLLVCLLRGLEGLRVLGVLLPVCGSPPAASVASDAAVPARVGTMHAAGITHRTPNCATVSDSKPPYDSP